MIAAIKKQFTNMSSQCIQCQQAFQITDSDQAYYERIQVPAPVLCPLCRLQRRYNLRNERVLYNRQCDLTGKPIVTIFAPDSPHTVYSQEAWWSDDWDQMQYGQAVDFTQPILKQLKAIQLKQPRLALLGKDSENSEYTNHSAHNKDCYLGFSLDNCEKVFYGYMSWDSSYLVDCSYMYDHSEMSYQCFYCHKCYGCRYLTLGRGCTDVSFSFDMSGCEHCFLSWNLRNKKYCFMNEQLSETAYHQRVAEFNDMTDQQQTTLIQQWQDIIKHKAIHRSSQQVNVSDSTGNYMTNCHAVQNGYYISDCENSAYLMQGVRMKDCMDCSNVAPAEAGYEMTGAINTNHSKFVNYSYDNQFIEYCDHVFNSQNMFACVGLNKKKFCILNKQYTEPEYQRLKEQVMAYMKTTGEYGSFFPFWYSPFAYNETVAYDLLPLNKADALALGASWRDSLDPKAPPADAVQANDLPDRISATERDILSKTMICSVSQRPYRIQLEEFNIYKQLGVPLPRKHPEVRFQERLQQRTKPQLYHRQCDHCHKELISTFAPGCSETVYCDSCYQAAIY